MGKRDTYNKVKVGQTPGDLSPEKKLERPAMKKPLKRKRRRQFQERTRKEIEESL